MKADLIDVHENCGKEDFKIPDLYDIVPKEEIADFEDIMRKIITGIISEASGIATWVYVQKYEKHKTLDEMNCSPSSRQLKKYKFFLPAEIYLLAVFMQLASKFHVFPLVLKFQDSFANVCCCSNLYNLRSFLREYFYQ